jgi:hypothetical protein
VSIIWIERVSGFLTDNPIADRISVKATAITTGAGALVADKTQQAAPEVVIWFGITAVDWAAIASIVLTVTIFGEKLVKGLYKAWKWYKGRQHLKGNKQLKEETDEL